MYLTGDLCAPEQQYGSDHAPQERPLEAVSGRQLLGSVRLNIDLISYLHHSFCYF